MENSVIILASGNGSRIGLDIPKQFFKINDKTILEYSIEAFVNVDDINSIVIVSHPDFIDLTQEIANKYTKVKKVVKGGSVRQISSYNGIIALSDRNIDKVLIHDAVRPFVNNKIISDCLYALNTFKAVNIGIEVSDTIVEVDEKNIIKNVPPRSKMKRCQTPQGFLYSIIKEAHKKAINENYYSATDDCSLILRYNLAPVYVVDGDKKNIKITYPSDIKRAEEIIM